MEFEWNYGDILDAVARVVPPERPALVYGDAVTTWEVFTQRTNRLAWRLLETGIVPGDKLAIYCRNRPEYAEAVAAAFKARLTPVNVNYRYVDRELLYLLDNSDAAVCVYAAEFADHVDNIRGQLPGVRLWIEIDDGADGLDDSLPYEGLAASGDDQTLTLERSGDDMVFVYTGGTTGMPKGVMWRHDDLWRASGAGGNARLGQGPCEDMAEHMARVESAEPIVSLPLPPLMHGTGLMSCIGAMMSGGTCVLLTGHSFDPVEALQAIERNAVTNMTIVGDAFARPLLDALDREPGRFDISSLRLIMSAGVMWTTEVKAGLLRHNEQLMLVDGLASSEAIGLGSSVMTKDGTIEVAKFTIGPNCRVFSEDLREIEPGSAEAGMVAVSGFLPLGYYKDEEKTSRTFKTVDGIRYSIPGDWVTVEADGTLTLLGRGSNCINTAGEKVFPEEVEEALKSHESIEDALVVGLPDLKWGQSITAVVKLCRGHELHEADLQHFLRERLAGYKIPKRILAKDDLERAPNGKADYEAIRRYATDSVS